MPLEITTTSYGAAAEDALSQAVQRAKRAADATDPLAPVTIIAPSFRAALHIRHLLGRRGRGIVNVQVKPLMTLLELVGAGTLAQEGRSPLPEAYRTEVIRAVAAAGPRRFGDLPIEGSVLRTLEQTFQQFDECDEAQLDSIAEAADMPAYLVSRYREYLDRTTSFYTTRDLADSASSALEAGGNVLRDIGAIIVYLPGEWTSAQMRFIRALAEKQDVQVILGLSGDAEAVDQPSCSRWQADPPTNLNSPPTAQRVVQSPDAEEEVRSAIRDISASVLSEQPMPLHRIAILYRQPTPYARICAEQLDAAAIPWNGPNAQTLGQSIAGRVLDGLLNLLESGSADWAADVRPWLTAGPIRDSQGALAPTSRWNRLSLQANLQQDPDKWLDRLDQYRRTRTDDLERLRKSAGEEHPGLFPWLREELQQIDALAEFTTEIVAFIRDTPEHGAWSEFSSAIRQQFTRLLGDRTAFAQAGVAGADDLELARWDDVQALLDSFNALDELGQTTGARFATAVKRGLERPTGHHGRIGEGVYVGALHSAIGMTWDIVYVVGAAERSLPQVGQEDPLLSDQLRERASLPVSRDHLRRERSDFLAALHAAPQRIISYPRADVRDQQARLPSRWLLESATSLNGGEPIYASKIGEADSQVVSATPSFERAIVSAPMAGDVQEYDLRSIRLASDVRRHFLTDEVSLLSRGFARHAARRSARFTRWDGLIEQGAAQAAGQPHSAGALQDWAACPHRYFLGRVLGIEERAELRDSLQISALDKGSLVHDILDRFFREIGSGPEPGSEWSESERARLMEIAEEELDEAHERGLTGRDLLWQRDRRRILADLETLLDEDAQQRATLQVRQVGSEVSFGSRMLDSQGAPTLTLEDGSRLELRGKIDRVDRSDDGRLLVVIDYKTGSEFPRQQDLDRDPVVRGKVLQLPVYAHALREIEDLNDDALVRSGYWFITERGGFRFNQVTWDSERTDRFRDTVNLIVGEVRAGTFPQHPGTDDRSRDNNCTYCSFNEVCPVDRRSRWDRIKSDERLAHYVALSAVADEDE